MVDDLYTKIVSERGSIEELVGRLPGFKGYMEMSARREADRMMRDHVATQYQSLIDRMSGIEAQIVRDVAGGLQFMDTSKSVKTRLETLRRRIATDTPGYSGFFAANKIDAEDLQNVYAFDQAMLKYTETIGDGLDGLSGAAVEGAGISEALTTLGAAVDEANRAYDLRDEVLNGLG